MIALASAAMRRPARGAASAVVDAVALDFLQLVAIDGKIAAGGRQRAYTRQWPNHCAKRRRRHYPQNEPERHVDLGISNSRSAAARGYPSPESQGYNTSDGRPATPKMRDR